LIRFEKLVILDKNSRVVSGKEIAIYHSNDLYQWNVWGTDNVGKINANGDKFFYLKDHFFQCSILNVKC